MAKERLSKLQKWILNKCYEREDKEFWRSYILRFFTKEKNIYTGRLIFKDNDRNKAEASITRSLKNLFRKGYIDLAIGNLGGSYILEDIKRGLLGSCKELKRLETGGKPAKFDDMICDIEYMKNLIADREKIIKERIFTPSIMGENIHRLKLTNEGIELVKSLKVKNNATSKT